jgi:hypothetical protein
LKRTCRLTTLHVLSGLLLIGGMSAAHATQCTASPGSVLESSLLTQSFSGPQGGCEAGWSGHDDEGRGDEGEDHEGGGWHDTKPPPLWQPPHDEWHPPHDGKDCNPSVVPLPPSALLLVSGAIGLLMLGRRRRSATA